MKLTTMKYNALKFLLIIGAGNLFAASPPSAFEARGIAEKQVNVQSQGKVIQMFGAHSTVGLYPTSWKILFWDPTAAQNGRLITVKDGAVNEIKDGFTELEHLRLAAYKENEIINVQHLKWDSSAALNNVMKMPALKDVKLSSVEFLLTKSEGAVQPLWHLKLFSDKAGTEVEIGQVNVSTETGEIFELKLQLEKLK
jgi:hypothetical protein